MLRALGLRLDINFGNCGITRCGGTGVFTSSSAKLGSVSKSSQGGIIESRGWPPTNKKYYAAQWLGVVSDESGALGASKAARVGSATIVCPELLMELDLALSFSATSAKVHSSIGFSSGRRVCWEDQPT